MKQDQITMATKVGAALGSLVFLIFGVWPGVYFGGYIALMMLNALVGSVEPTFFVRTIVMAGTIMGVACVAAVSLVVGGVVGAATGVLVSLPSLLRKRK